MWKISLETNITQMYKHQTQNFEETVDITFVKKQQQKNIA